jgi:hypothetical protein
MGDTTGEARRSKAANILGMLVLVAIFWWGITYIPVVRDHVPSVISIESTSRIGIGDLPAAADTLPATVISAACHDIPFLMRPIAGGTAATARIIFTDKGHDLGEIRFDCHTGAILSDRKY